MKNEGADIVALGKEIRSIRRSFGIKQRWLAERSGIHPSQLSRLEAGKENPPVPVKLIALVEALPLDRADAERLIQLAGYSSRILEQAAVRPPSSLPASPA